MASPAVRLLSFLILLAVMFAVAYLVGSRLGPLNLTHAHSGSMHMGMRAAQVRVAGYPRATVRSGP
jgi:uncharacterized RDD family membrane protein YckC